jgi:hypothetical protein
MIAFLIKLAKNIFSVFLNILPILVVVTSFQLFVIKQPFPDLAATISGMIFVLVGLFLYTRPGDWFVSPWRKDGFPVLCQGKYLVAAHLWIHHRLLHYNC